MKQRSILYEQESEFTRRNTFLYFVLGLISVATRLLQQLRSEAESPESTSEGEPANGTALDDSVLRDLLR